jgi:hypothetical protein
MIKKLLMAAAVLSAVLAFGQTVHMAGREVSNVFSGATNQFTNGVQFGPLLVVSLPALPNGSILWASDGNAGTSPCTGGGTGAFAYRVSGVWACGNTIVAGLPTGVVAGSVCASNGIGLPCVYQTKPVIDVRDYGVIGNGANDDTAALQNAINAGCGTGSTPGAMVITPKGAQIVITSSITNPAGCEGLLFDGQSATGQAGFSTTIIWKGGSGGYPFSLNRIRDSIFRNFTINVFNTSNEPNGCFILDENSGSGITSHNLFENISCGMPGSMQNTNFAGVLVCPNAPGNCEQQIFVDFDMACGGGSLTDTSNGVGFKINKVAGAAQPFYVQILRSEVSGCSHGVEVNANARQVIIDGGNYGSNYHSVYLNSGNGVVLENVVTTQDISSSVYLNGYAGILEVKNNAFTGGGANVIDVTNASAGLSLTVEDNNFGGVPIFTGTALGGSYSGYLWVKGNTNFPAPCPTQATGSFGTFLRNIPTSGTCDDLYVGSPGAMNFGFASRNDGVNNSPAVRFEGAYQNSGTPTFATDYWQLQNVVGAGTNGSSKLTLTHAGTSSTTTPLDLTGASVVQVASLIVNGVGSGITFGTGMGNVNQITGPSDQPFQIATQNNKNLVLAPNGTGQLIVNSVATSPTTAPVCPNGTGGAFTTTGCAGTTFNGGTVTNPTNFTSTVAIAGPRPWIDVTNPTYGADPTGAADSTAAINSAIAACAGGTVLFPPGTYKHTSQLTFGTSCTLLGLGPLGGATILKSYNSTGGFPGASGSVIISASNFTMSNLVYNGNYNAQTAATGVTNGTTTFTVSSGTPFSSSNTGQTISIVGGLASGNLPLTTTVTFVNSTTLTLASCGAGCSTASGLTWYLGYGGPCITDATNNTNLHIRNNQMFGCSNTMLTLTASGAGGTGVNTFDILNNTITGSAIAPAAINLQETILNGKINDNFLDCSLCTGPGYNTLGFESQGLTTNISNLEISRNTIAIPVAQTNGLTWGIQGGNFNAYASTNIQILDNYIYAVGSGTGTSSSGCISLQGVINSVINGNICDFKGIFAYYTGYEFIGGSGVTITGNTFNTETAGGNGSIVLSGSSSHTISGNTFNGWGANGSASGFNSAVAMGVPFAAVAINSCSETGNVATYVANAAIGQLQPGITVYFAGTFTPAGYGGGPYLMQNANYVRGGSTTTFSVILPTTGLGACTVEGTVNGGDFNNNVTGNTFNFPVGLYGAITSPLYGLQFRGTPSGSYVSNNRVCNNIFNGPGTAAAAGTGLTFQTVISDSNVVCENTFQNLPVGIQASGGTNNNILNNTYTNVTTVFNGTTGIFTTQNDFLAAANLTAGFGSTATVSGSTNSFTITASGTGQTTTPGFTALIPAFATGLNCWITDQTTAVTAKQTAGNTTTVTFTFSAAPTAGDVLRGGCSSI